MCAITNLSEKAIENATKEGLYHPTQFEKDIHTYARKDSPKWDAYAYHLNCAFVIAPHAHDVSAIHDMLKHRFAALHKRDERGERVA